MSVRFLRGAAAAGAVVVASVLPAGPFSAASGDSENPFDPPVAGYVGPNGAGVVEPPNTLNPDFVGWASRVVDYAPTGQAVQPPYNDPALALGSATGDQLDVVSLGELTTDLADLGGEPGTLTLGFDVVIADGPGPDIAVFENSFIALTDGLLFAELAFVEVSSDGSVFARFPAEADTAGPPQPFTTLDPTDIYNLAGKHLNGGGASWGTPFDLAELAGAPEVVSGAVDPGAIRFVRIVDIPGDGSFADAMGRAVFDPWPTSGSGGVDIDAVGVLNAVTTAVGEEWGLYE